MERVTARDIELTWDPTTRVAKMRQKVNATGEQARQLVDAFTTWIGTDAKPFALLVDASEVAITEPGWRAEWASFFQAHRDRACLAIFGASSVVRILIELFRVGTRVQLRAFDTETSAREWLRTKGLVA